MPLLGAIAGLPLLGIGGGWVYKLADWMWCHCWVPLLGIGGVGVKVGGLDVVTLLGAVAGCHCWAAIAGCHCWG